MVSICFDIGNTQTKFAIFNNHQINHFGTIDIKNFSLIDQTIKENNVEAAIVSSVAEVPDTLLNFLSQKLFVINLTAETKLPIENCYETKETLGKDRLAAVVGANFLYPGTDLLIIDAGTAITYDLIVQTGRYLGGNISPGIQMRFKALNHFTSRLPLVEKAHDNVLYGKNTTEAIRAGVQNGIIFEVDGTIDHFRQLYPGLKVLFTGGDAKFFDNKLKNVIFVLSNLVMTGLNRILVYNAQNT